MRKCMFLILVVVLIPAGACRKGDDDLPARAEPKAVKEVPEAGTPPAPFPQPDPIGWRGDGSGKFLKADPPLEWDDKKNIVWEAQLPDEGYGSPVVSAGKVFVTSEPEMLGCYDAADGKLLWQVSLGIEDIPEALRAKVKGGEYESGNAAQAPVADGKRVFVQMASGIVACYDYSGQRQWVVALGIPPVSGDGRSSSPVLADGILVVATGHLFGLKAADGSIQWETDKIEEGYGSLIAAEVAGAKVVVTPTGAVVAVRDGAVLVKELCSLAFNSPVVERGIMYFIESGALAYPLPADIEPYKPEEKWIDGYGNEFYASPVIHAGLGYAVSNEGIFYIFDAETGKALIEQPLSIPPSPMAEGGGGEINMYASICLAGTYLFVCNSIGDTAILKPGREYNEIAVNSLVSDGWGGTPFFKGKRIYFRFGDRLICVGKD